MTVRLRFAMVVLLTLITGDLARAQDKARLVLGASSKTLGYSPLWVSLKKGFFEQQGLDVQLVLLRGVPMTVQAMRAGAVEFLTKPLAGDALVGAIQQAIERRYTLIESTGKKVKFLRHAVERLDLPNVEVLHGRAEALKPSQPFDSVISRALGPLSDFVRFAGHLAGRRGRLLAMKGRAPAQELKALPPGWKALAVHAVRVPGLDAERCLVELARV